MKVAQTIGNIIWCILGGIILAMAWLVIGVACCITIVGIPFGLQCFKFAWLVLWPFGKEVTYTVSTSSVLLNAIWILLCGFTLACIHGVLGILCCITLVGIPLGLQHFKFIKLSIFPFGTVVA